MASIKYAHIVKNLPPMPDEDPGRRELLDRVKQEILSAQPDDQLSDDGVHALVKQMSANIAAILEHEKTAVAGKPYASELTRTYIQLRILKDIIKDWLSSTHLLFEAYEELMLSQLENEGLTTLKMSGGGGITTFAEPYASVEDSEAFRLWCLANGFEHDMHLHPMRRQSLVKEMLLNGEPEPPGIKTFAKTIIRVSKP